MLPSSLKIAYVQRATVLPIGRPLWKPTRFLHAHSPSHVPTPCSAFHNRIPPPNIPNSTNKIKSRATKKSSKRETISPKHNVRSAAHNDTRRHKNMKATHTDKEKILANKLDNLPAPADTAVVEAAAQRVFNLPELLEQILVERGNNVRNASRSEQIGVVPVLELFVLQRVNSTFKSTITTSPALQQLMGLEPMPDANTEKGSLQQRSIWVNWFISGLTSSTNKLEYFPDERGDVVSISVHHDSYSERNFAKLQRSTAWRSLFLSLITEPNKYCCGKVRVQDEKLEETFTFGPGATLGELADEIPEMMLKVSGEYDSDYLDDYKLSDHRYESDYEVGYESDFDERLCVHMRYLACGRLVDDSRG